MVNRIKERNSNNGLMTVEAAIAFPIFFFSIILFLYFLQALNIQEKIHQGITNLGTEIAGYGFILQDFLVDENDDKDGDYYDIKENFGIDFKMLSLADHLFLKYRIEAHLDLNFIERSCVVDGFSGLSFWGSSLLDDEGYVDVMCNYQIEFPVPFFSLGKIDVLQRVRIRSFRGLQIASRFKESEKGEETKEEDIVYITETGKVYHTSQSCTHLKLSIKKISMDEIPESRNEYGAKYDLCKRCASNTYQVSLVYITKSGTNYHFSIGCSGLKRTIKKVKIKDVLNWKLCERCGK